MSTRGTWGFVVDGDEKLTYNHFDSYPGGLGCDILAFLSDLTIDTIAEQARGLRLVTEEDEPTPEDIERLQGYHDSRVSTGKVTEWYSLLRDTQGDPLATLKAGVMIDGRDFPLDSLFCEWAYVIDLDHEQFEVYKGFQHDPHEDGRFASRGTPRLGGMGDMYYPVRLVASFSLHGLPDADAFTRWTDPPEDEDE